MKLTFEERLTRYRNELRVKRLTRQIYDCIARLEKIPRLITELKETA